MQIQVNTDNHIDGNVELFSYVKEVVRDSLSKFGDRITRVEVHLSDENSHKSSGDDKKCVIEARMAGKQPIAVTHQGETLNHAIHGASDKLKHAFDKVLGKLQNR